MQKNILKMQKIFLSMLIYNYRNNTDLSFLQENLLPRASKPSGSIGAAGTRYD